MKKITLGIIAVVSICITGYVVLGYTGYVITPLNTTMLYPNIQEIDTIPLIDYIDDDIELIQSIISGLSDELDVHVYGINDQSAFSVISWYEQTNIQNGWGLLDDVSADSSGQGWNGYLRAWQKGYPGRGQVVITLDGYKVEQYSNYDTLVLTSSAPMTAYMNIIAGFQE
jgi:hypothetical protein